MDMMDKVAFALAALVCWIHVISPLQSVLISSSFTWVYSIIFFLNLLFFGTVIIAAVAIAGVIFLYVISLYMPEIHQVRQPKTSTIDISEQQSFHQCPYDHRPDFGSSDFSQASSDLYKSQQHLLYRK